MQNGENGVKTNQKNLLEYHLPQVLFIKKSGKTGLNG